MIVKKLKCSNKIKKKLQKKDPNLQSNEDLVVPVEAALKFIFIFMLSNNEHETIHNNEKNNFFMETNNKYLPPKFSVSTSSNIDNNNNIIIKNNDDINDNNGNEELRKNVEKSLIYLRDRIGVPRDMSVFAAQQFRSFINYYIDNYL
jgi:hypothetical protein